MTRAANFSCFPHLQPASHLLYCSNTFPRKLRCPERLAGLGKFKGKGVQIMRAMVIQVERLNSAIGKRGTTLVEYALVLLLVAFVLVLIVTGLGEKTNNTYSKINSGIFKSSP